MSRMCHCPYQSALSSHDPFGKKAPGTGMCMTPGRRVWKEERKREGMNWERMDGCRARRSSTEDILDTLNNGGTNRLREDPEKGQRGGRAVG